MFRYKYICKNRNKKVFFKFLTQKMKNNILGANVQYLINTTGLSQKDFAQKIGWSASTISNAINGRSELSIDRLIQLTDYFDISVDDLLRKDLSKEFYKSLPDASVVADPEVRMLQLVEAFGKQVDELKLENVKLKKRYEFLLERFPEQMRILQEEFGEDIDSDNH
jgi:transcriptional regulator with XRE-family HTH domain